MKPYFCYFANQLLRFSNENAKLKIHFVEDLTYLINQMKKKSNYFV